MPSFVNDENSPIYAPSADVVRLDHHSQHQPQDHADLDFAISKAKEAASRRPLTTAVPQPPVECLDDNSSSHSSINSSDSSDPRLRMNGDGTASSSMTDLPNGKFTNGLNGFHGDGVMSQEEVPNGTKPVVDAEPVTTKGNLPPPSHPPPPRPVMVVPPESQPKATVESPARSSLQQTPVELHSKPFLPGDISHSTPDAPPFLNLDLHATGDAPSSSLQPTPTVAQPTTPISDSAERRKSNSHRFSSPPQYGGSTSSTSLQNPNTLKHRHTLEVPKPQPARNSRDGQDAAWASGRFSPTTAPPAVRRGSLSLARRNTRSMHSELHRDEIIPDDDALRWAEAYRQKRARKKKREEEEDDDRVLVGTKVDENHANWTTAYNMLTGIRVSVSRTNAKLDRPLTDADFEAKSKTTFDIAGNELVPSAKYDFKFKDYAPWVFRHLRALFGLDPADYLVSLTGKYILSELGSPGKSGSFFYFSRDYKYIIKTIHHSEHKFLRKILKDYYNHVTDNPNTLLSQFYGLHRVKMPYGKKIHFVVMNNLFPPHRDIHQTFDLKGSTSGRDYKEEDLEKNPRATLKDLNWLRRNRHLELGILKKQLFLQQLEKDVRLLQRLEIMDYSLLVGVHDLQKGNEENLRDKTLQVFNPGGGRERTSEDQDPHSVLMRSPSKLEHQRKARELRQMIKSERPVPVGQTSDRMPDVLMGGQERVGLFYQDDGGLQATHEDNSPAEEVYYLGVIDCLTHYGMIKKLETFWKGLSHDRSQISALPPSEYGERFIKFMSGITMSPEAADRDQREREAAAAAAAAAEAEMLPSRRNSRRNSNPPPPPPPNYLPPPPPSQRTPKSPELNPTVEKAKQKAAKTEVQGASEEGIPDRVLSTTANIVGQVAVKASAHAILPVVEEAAEAASVGTAARGEGENASGSRPFTPNPTERQDGFTDLAPHGIGGRGPPTPPKTSYVGLDDERDRSGNGNTKSLSRESLDKALPPLPQ